MAILSNKGRVIQSLANYTNPKSGDLLVIQDVLNNQTKNITLSQLAATVAGQVQGAVVNFNNPLNKFTGSFQGVDDGWFRGDLFSGSRAIFDNSLTVLGNNRFKVDYTGFFATNFNQLILGTTGNPIQLQNDTIIDKTLTVVEDVQVTGVVYGNVDGNVLGSLTGDVYSDAGNKVLENSANLAKNALFYGTSSFAHRATTASYAEVAQITLTCVTNATTADFATFAGSSSYASASRSSSYLWYHPILNPKNGSASYALKAYSADSATNANNATNASFLLYTGVYNGSASYALSSSKVLSASYARSASYVRSSSYSKSGSYARSASYAKSGSYSNYAALAGTVAAPYSQQSNYTLTVSNPTGVISYGKYLFFTQRIEAGTPYQTLYRVNQETGEVTKLYRGLLTDGRMSLHKFTFNPTTAPQVGTTESGTEDRIVYCPNGYVVIISNLLAATPTVRVITVSNGGGWREYRCVYVDSTVTGYQSDVHPTFYMWQCDYEFSYASLGSFYKIAWNGSPGTAYVYTNLSATAPSFTAALASNIVNYTDFIEDEAYNYITDPAPAPGTAPLFAANIWETVYNQANKRIYFLSAGTGLVNIFNLNAAPSGYDNIATWYQMANSATKYSYLTYEKSVMLPHGQPYTNTGANELTDNLALEYNTTTGEELFWSMNRYGSDNYWLGTISKARYWES